MYCYDVCVCLCAGVCTVFLGCLSQTGWCPLTFVSILETGCFRQPMTHQVGFNRDLLPHLETFKLVSPRQHTTTFRCTKTKNTTFSNVIMLLCVSLKLVHSRLFSSRKGGNYICICVSLCGVVMPQVDLVFRGFVVGRHGEGGWSKDCHITPVI
ncbi:hypothetical protein PFLUV_G00178150 [Perca fluviatilis]|uniref:Uncharacterized protein n=1 Tax=Perca fluviatilis TaxID=8168 RepID=A0A6A5EYP7_PERFL|nr:hypothetical protein PFLUV_G00178150 [Perca fluviatilis]